MSCTLIYAALAATTLGGFATSAEAAGNAPHNLAFAGTGRRSLHAVGRGAVWKIRALAGGPEGRGK